MRYIYAKIFNNYFIYFKHLLKYTKINYYVNKQLYDAYAESSANFSQKLLIIAPKVYNELKQSISR